jgi:hypothetical protein
MYCPSLIDAWHQKRASALAEKAMWRSFYLVQDVASACAERARKSEAALEEVAIRNQKSELACVRSRDDWQERRGGDRQTSSPSEIRSKAELWWPHLWLVCMCVCAVCVWLVCQRAAAVACRECAAEEQQRHGTGGVCQRVRSGLWLWSTLWVRF